MESIAINKQVYRYTAVFEPDRDGGYTVTIPVLPGCISEGNTFEDALRNIKEAAALYLEVAREEHQEGLLPQESKAIVTSVEVMV